MASIISDETPAPDLPGSFLVGELPGLLQLPRLLMNAPKLARAPRGTGPVMLMPGFGTSDSVMAPLRKFLSGRGYDASGWGLGRNRGNVARNLRTVANQVERAVNEHGQPVGLIGWSLGGVFAREVARDHPELVTSVSTFGAPIVGGVAFTRSSGGFGADSSAIVASRDSARNDRPIETPILAIYSKNDHVVDWRSCVDTWSPNATNLEVNSTHSGMIIDPDVWSAIAGALAAVA